MTRTKDIYGELKHLEHNPLTERFISLKREELLRRLYIEDNIKTKPEEASNK